MSLTVILLHFLLVCALPVCPSLSQISLWSPQFHAPVRYHCDRVTFPQEIFITCACLHGAWALQMINQVEELSWKLISGAGQCYRINEWIQSVLKVSDCVGKPILRKLSGTLSTFLVANNGSWAARGSSWCLSAPRSGAYCIYSMPLEIPLGETDFVANCTKNLEEIKPVRCGSFNGDYEDECGLVTSRRKRAVDTADPIMNEDELDAAVMRRYAGDEQITDSLIDYLKIAVQNMLGLRVGSSKRKPTPVQSLLQLTAEITKLTCDVVNSDTIEVAMKTLFVQQNERNHIREPFLSYAAYRRILKALETCKNEAKAYEFLLPQADVHSCDAPDNKITSEYIYRWGYNVSLPSLPASVVADPDRFEPIVEIAWKTFLIAHSYCYTHFSNYFNDHHLFTVIAVAYFSNRIQDTWFVRYRSSHADFTEEPIKDSQKANNGDYRTDKIWYGGLLGDVSGIFRDIDRCYRASRLTIDEHPSYQYPWFMNRPPRDKSHDWGRRKRSIRQTEGRCNT